jgi:predicted nuclease of predicted toxin-antitoxin system
LKFLIDECLHTSLVAVAQERGHQADHVNWIGLKSWQDWNLMPIVIAEAYTFVTENRDDFLRLFSLEPAHNGLVVFMRKAQPPVQRELFHVVLDVLGEAGDLFNQAIKVQFAGTPAAAASIGWERVDLAQPE